jgi:hypothetical protein
MLHLRRQDAAGKGAALRKRLARALAMVRRVSAGLIGACLVMPASGQADQPAILFNRDVRPLLSENCFHCHGPDKIHREADLRLDDRQIAVDTGAIVPGDPDSSELIRRLQTGDADERMPPVETHKSLTPDQIDLLRRWVQEGAPYQRHWAYEPPTKLPDLKTEAAIDALVRQRLASQGLRPAEEADRRTLIRRLSFDLLGLPPRPEEVDAFIADASPEAYEHLVEQMLASPHFGERMAQGWLDVVRFADTIGYHSDNPHEVWPYRDYVIQSFNDNKPFDQFTVEQLAGDLLPERTQQQLVGSCFNRLLLTTQEGGAQPKDYEARMLTDRVRAVGTVWLGQTFGCCQCHDHKFDPMTQRDFYSLGAFFADIDEPIIGAREPGMLLPAPEQEAELTRLRNVAVPLRRQYDVNSPELMAAEKAWEELVLAGVEYGARRQAIEPTAAPATEAPSEPVPAAATPPAEIVALLRLKEGERTPEQYASILAHFKSQLPELADLRSRMVAADKAVSDLENSLPRCMVSKSLASPRTVRILPRGNWMDESGPVVEPTLPGYLAQPAISSDRRLTRLDLARWITSRDNPLTARVVVNRLWRQFFGTGISKSIDDLGSQGEWPTNPELLDWLACEFMDSGWDVKHLIRLIVTSHTYRQVSTAAPEMLARDPENRLLARQSRYRLDAELVRDNALAISGLLTPAIGGPSVKPYQPEGYWENLNFPVRSYDADRGPNQYRRGLYMWWQRSFLHPSLLAFDAPSREECCADRPRSNIPQQALVLLNDPTYVEAARAFAARIIAEGGAESSSRIRWAWRQALDRAPRDEELSIAAALFEKHRSELAADPAAAEQLIHVGQAPPPEHVDHVELAAWTSVARLVLNLHETIVRN